MQNCYPIAMEPLDGRNGDGEAEAPEDRRAAIVAEIAYRTIDYSELRLGGPLLFRFRGTFLSHKSL